MVVTDIEFNTACWKLYETDKIPYPKWDEGKAHYGLSLFTNMWRDGIGCARICLWDDRRGEDYDCLSQHEAACINECYLREWLVLKDIGIYKRNKFDGHRICNIGGNRSPAWGHEWYSSYQEALLAAVNTILERIGEKPCPMKR